MAREQEILQHPPLTHPVVNPAPARARGVPARTAGLGAILTCAGALVLAPGTAPASLVDPAPEPSVWIPIDDGGTQGADETLPADDQLATSVPSLALGANIGDLIGANRFYTAGITGQNTIAANVEAGHIWNGHETLTQVTTFVNDPTTFHSTAGNTEFDRHATWVGMMIGGRNGGTVQGARQTGIAPGTDLRSGAMATSWSGTAWATGFNVSLTAYKTAYTAFFGTADVINSSIGGTDATGTSFLATVTDTLQNQYRTTTFVASAGNSGPGVNSVGAPGSGYNVITVGALQNNGANVYNTIASFSSRGPQSYSDPVHGTITGVRAAVDLVAPGTGLVSAYYGGQTGGNNPSLSGSPSGIAGAANTYSSALQGTSFAAPIVAGAVALLDSGSKADRVLTNNQNARDARVIKAVLQNSADKIPGWSNGQTKVGGVIQTTQSLDWTSGAGALNLDRAYDQYLAAGTRDLSGVGGGTVNTVGWDYGELAAGATNTYVINQILLAGSTFTATLDWFRDRGYNPLSGAAVEIAQANLDLIIRDVVSGVVAQSISLYNVVEHLSFLLPTTGLYAIDVRYTGNSFGAITGEQYGLAWSSVAAPAPAPGTLFLVLLGAAALPPRRRSTPL